MLFNLINYSSGSISSVSGVRRPPVLTGRALGVRKLGRYGGTGSDQVRMGPRRPLAVVIRNYFTSINRFGALTSICKLCSRRTVYFRCSSEGDLRRASNRLISTLGALSGRGPGRSLRIVKRDRNNLITQQTLATSERSRGGITAGRLRLAAVSSPFGNVRVSSRYNVASLQVLSLNVISLVYCTIAKRGCRRVPPGTSFVRRPNSLLSSISRRLIVGASRHGAYQEAGSRKMYIRSSCIFDIGRRAGRSISGVIGTSLMAIRTNRMRVINGKRSIPASLVSVLGSRRLLVSGKAIKRLRRTHLVRRLCFRRRDSDLSVLGWAK